MPDTTTPTAAEALQSAGDCLAFHPRDWSVDRRDAWLWGVIVGWDQDSLWELAAKHGWSAEEVERLQGLHAALEAAVIAVGRAE